MSVDVAPAGERRTGTFAVGDPVEQEPVGAESARPGRRLRLARLAAWAVFLPALVSAPWWGRAALQELDFFHVRSIEVEGVRYLDPAVVARSLEVDTLRSVWDELRPLEVRVAGHPQVASVSVERRLPGTLVVRIEERTPVAFAATVDGLEILDAAGTVLPIDPSRTPVDLPLVTPADSGLLAMLGELRAGRPSLYARVSEVRRTEDDELVFSFDSIAVRAAVDVTARRLAEVEPVEADLARRDVRPAELDLRFRDQVIARVQ